MNLSLWRLRTAATLLGASPAIALLPVVALPPPEDPPEEVLRTEIVLEARSPIDGRPLTAAEYAELQAQLESRPNPPVPSPEVERVVRLLYLRRAIRAVFPFLLD